MPKPQMSATEKRLREQNRLYRLANAHLAGQCMESLLVLEALKRDAAARLPFPRFEETIKTLRSALGLEEKD